MLYKKSRECARDVDGNGVGLRKTSRSPVTHGMLDEVPLVTQGGSAR
jgi:hypothetical protein